MAERVKPMQRRTGDRGMPARQHCPVRLDRFDVGRVSWCAMEIGPYTGDVTEAYRTDAALVQLAGLSDVLASAAAVEMLAGRNRLVRVCLASSPDDVQVVVKAFGRQNALQDRRARARGSKAHRTWDAARHLQAHGIGTPAPVAFLDRWEGNRLLESYVLTAFADGVTSFADELGRLFYDDPLCATFMTLMQRVAHAVRAMHDSGFQHNDLGNQNILLRREGDDDWTDVQFVDLNRARVRDRLTLRERARDISRIYLPSDLLRVFMDMYFGDVVPKEFHRWEERYRKAYAWHDRTRRLRHPIREARQRKLDGERRIYPVEKDLWIWDERSAQAISTMRPRDRHRHYSPAHMLGLAGAALRAALPVRREFLRLLDACYAMPVAMRGRIGVALNPRPNGWNREFGLLRRLGTIPVLVRFYHHESLAEWNFAAQRVRELHAAGHAVAIALVQDRQAVLHLDQWASFVSHVLSRTAEYVDYVEVGHAINRAKWGVWDSAAYGRMTRAVATVSEWAADVRFMGPAVIDFEMPDVVGALAHVSPGLHFSALSHHMYVDRRGAPENRQGRFSALEKFALARAIARWSDACDDRLIVSEVNWPLEGTGVYSPVNSPYESHGVRYNDPSVSEDDYADFMLRYLLMALCSGMVERVYWWRLVARGFGLVDDSDSDNWRERPAYSMLRVFLDAVQFASFVGKTTPEPGCHVFTFEGADGQRFALAYCQDGQCDIAVPFALQSVQTALGQTVAWEGGRVTLTGRPVYLR